LARKKPVAPPIAFFLVNHGIPTVSIGFSDEQSILFGGILTAISSLTSSETGMGMLDDIQAQNGRIFIQKVGDDSLVGFFIFRPLPFDQKVERQLKVLAGMLGTRYLSDYVYNPMFEEILLIGALPEKFQVKLGYQAVVAWRKQVRHSPFKETDTLSKLLKKIDRKFLDNLGLSVSDLTFAEKIENTIDTAVWTALGSVLKNDMSILITARDIGSILPSLRSQMKNLIIDEIGRKGPASHLKKGLAEVKSSYNPTMDLAEVKKVTAVLLLKEFISGYNNDPFGEQGLVITKQLLDIGFSKQSLESILGPNSQDIIKILVEEEALFDFRKNPFFHAFLTFLMGETPESIKSLSGDQLKKELAGLVSKKRPVPSLEIDRVMYDLSGNPETASHAKKSLENALIKTTSALLYFLLVGNDSNIGKILNDLILDICKLSDRVKEINYFIIFFRELINYKWSQTIINGCLPTLEQLNTSNLCKLLQDNPENYLVQLEKNNKRKLDQELRFPLLSKINECWKELQNSSFDFELDVKVEYPEHQTIKKKIIKGLGKITKRSRSGKKVSEQDVNNLKESVQKEYLRQEERIIKEIRGFKKVILAKKIPEPPWFKYSLKEGGIWEVIDPKIVIKSISETFTLTNYFQNKNKSDRQIHAVFDMLGGIQIAFEAISANHFYDQLPPDILEIIENPLSRKKRKSEISFLREKNYKEGVGSLREYFDSNSGLIVSTLLSQCLTIIKDSYFRIDPEVFMDDENLHSPNYLFLLELPRELIEESNPIEFFGEKHFIFQKTDQVVRIGFHLDKWKGRGNRLFDLLVSSSSLESAHYYKQATKVLGHFSGFVYSAAVGNLHVCPRDLNQVSDLFL
jgi:hypothetical protein